jgi:hypothetical protein
MTHTTDYYMKRKAAMKTERESFIPHYKETSEFVKPRRGRFLVSDRNKGDKRYSSIINSRATQAHRIATSGMLAGTMSPSRPWFDLETNDPDLMESQAVKEWLHQVSQKIRDIFNGSNLYGMSSNLLGELLLFGTGAMLHVDDYEDVARFYTLTAGSYLIAQNDRYEVDTLFREFEWPVRSIVGRFGLDNVSTAVKTAYDKSNYDNWFPVNHMIEPNEDHNPNSPFSQNKAFASVYFELSNVNNKNNGKFLSKMGFDEFPGYVPRWDLTGEDIYGTDCPAMTALGDIKGLQVEEKRKAQGIDKMVNPPLTGPPSVRNSPVNSLPGGLTIYDNAGGMQDLKALYNVNLSLNELRLDMDSVERRINEAFFVDLFLAISQMEGIQPRNQLDLMQRNEERLLQLGPVLERIHGEFLSKLVDRTFKQCVEADILPEAPEELQGANIKVKFISTMAMAQRAIATQGIERLAGFVGSLAQINPQVVEKFNAEQAVDEYAKAIGAPPTVIVPDEVIDANRQKQAQAADAQAGMDAANQMAGVAKQMADAKTGEDPNALTDALG